MDQTNDKTFDKTIAAAAVAAVLRGLSFDGLGLRFVVFAGEESLKTHCI